MKMKKRLLSLVLASVLVFSLAACSKDTEPAPAPATEAPAGEEQGEAPAETPTAEDTNVEPSGQLIIGTSTETNGDYTPFWTNNASDYDVYKLATGHGIADITKDGTFAFSDNTFQSVEEAENEDGSKTWTFTLQPGLAWSNGEPITAKDYVGSALLGASKVLNIDLEASQALFQYQYLKGFEEYYAGETDVLPGVHLLGEDKFSVTASEKYLPYYYGKTLINFDPMYIKGWLPEDITIEETEGGAKFVGDFTAEHIKDNVEKERYTPTANSGPYKLVKYEEGAYSYTLERNDKYKGNYEGQTANIQTIVYRYVSQDTMMDELKTGGVDLLLDVMDGPLISAGLDMVDAGTHDYLNYPRDGFGRIIFKANVGPTQFVEVRQAVAHLLDRNEFAKTFTGGHGSVVHGYYGLSQWMVEEAEDEIASLNPYNYSLEEAKKLLDAGGWTKDKDGKDYSGQGLRYKEVDGKLMPLSLKWCSSEANSVSDLLVTMLANNPDVAAAGMEIKQHVVTYAELSDAFYTDKDNYHMFNMGLGFSVPFDIKEDYKIDGEYNYNRINDEELAKLALDMTQVSEDNDEEYLAKWVAFQQRWNKLLPDIPLYSNDIHDFYSKKLVGYEGRNAIWDSPRAILYARVTE